MIRIYGRSIDTVLTSDFLYGLIKEKKINVQVKNLIV